MAKRNIFGLPAMALTLTTALLAPLGTATTVTLATGMLNTAEAQSTISRMRCEVRYSGVGRTVVQARARTNSNAGESFVFTQVQRRQLRVTNRSVRGNMPRVNIVGRGNTITQADVRIVNPRTGIDQSNTRFTAREVNRRGGTTKRVRLVNPRRSTATINCRRG